TTNWSSRPASTWTRALWAAGFVLVLGVIMNGRQQGRPRAGETVTPRLEGPVHWTAGTSGDLGIRLYAQGPDAKRGRLLGFGALPWGVDPMAQIVFYEGSEFLRSVDVALSHRC